MYARWFLAILALIGATLACSYPGIDSDTVNPLAFAEPQLIKHGDITLDLSKATSSQGSMTPGWGCWPPKHNKEGGDNEITGSFAISLQTSTSNLNGECSSNTGAKATLTGTIDWTTETVEFTLVVTSTSQLNISETIKGKGSFMASNRAEGNADWSMSCAENGTGNGYVCFAEEAHGTVPWTMTFTP